LTFIKQLKCACVLKANIVNNIMPPWVDCIFVRKPLQLGLSHAVLLADDFLIHDGGAVTADLCTCVFRVQAKHNSA
jgi:UTP-glucose-1-phosphate uridylyltransferase